MTGFGSEPAFSRNSGNTNRESTRGNTHGCCDPQVRITPFPRITGDPGLGPGNDGFTRGYPSESASPRVTSPSRLSRLPQTSSIHHRSMQSTTAMALNCPWTHSAAVLFHLNQHWFDRSLWLLWYVLALLTSHAWLSTLSKTRSRRVFTTSVAPYI